MIRIKKILVALTRKKTVGFMKACLPKLLNSHDSLCIMMKMTSLIDDDGFNL